MMKTLMMKKEEAIHIEYASKHRAFIMQASNGKVDDYKELR